MRAIENIKDFFRRQKYKHRHRFQISSYNFHHRKIAKHFEKRTDNIFEMFSDHEVKVLLLWSLIGPLCALGYIVWIKYPKLRLMSLIFFVLNMVYMMGQIGGWLYIIPKLSIFNRLFV